MTLPIGRRSRAAERGRQLQAASDRAGGGKVGDEGEDFHITATERAQQGVDLIEVHEMANRDVAGPIRKLGEELAQRVIERKLSLLMQDSLVAHHTYGI